MSRAWLVVVLALAGCPSSNGASDGGAGDLAVTTADDLATGGGTPADLLQAPNTANIGVTSATSAMDKSYIASANFIMGVLPPSPCVLTNTTYCQAAACTVPSADAGSPAPTYSLVSGGTVTVGGGAMPVTLTPMAGTTGYYPPVPSTTQPLFTGGETLTLANSGATAPASSTMVVAPSPPTVTTPSGTSYTITRSAGFTLAWTGGGPGNVSFAIASAFPTNPGDPYGSVRCSFPVADGQATIPASALAALPAGNAFFQISVVNTVSSTVNDWVINASATTYPLGTGGQPFTSGGATIN